MRYYVSLDPQGKDGTKPVEVDVTELPSGELDVRIDGQPANVDVVALGAALSVRIDGRMVDLTTEGTPPDIGVIASGHRSYVHVVSERQRAADAAKKGDARAGEKLVKSPMPGRIVKVLVQAGDEVAAGQSLLVMEAMKMENEVRAKSAGTIAEVHVATGAAVEANAKLVSLK
jgi:biotin carboxyl carrier protein